MADFDGDYPSKTKPKHNVPGNPQIWSGKDASGAQTFYLVYFVPDTDPPVPLAYRATKDQVQGVFGPDNTIVIDQQVNGQLFASWGVIRAGDFAELHNTTEDPFDAWAATVGKEAEVRPWLKDPTVLAAIAEAQLEGRTITQAEMEQTNWWRNNNPAQRQWALVYESDPSAARQRIDDAKIRTRESLQNAGVNNPPEAVVDYMARQWATGEWSQDKFSQQILAVSDPAAGVDIDSGLSAAIGSARLDTTRYREDTVRDEVAKWLGPAHGNWSQDQINRWAGILRNDPDGEIQLTEALRKQRMALFQEYTNPDLTYEDIAGPWRNFVMNMWGEQADETSNDFLKVVRMNDAAEAGKYLRSRGLELGKGKVLNDLAGEFSGVREAGSVRGAF